MTKAWKEKTIVYKVKRIVWDMVTVKELADKGIGLQWWPEADPVKIHQKSAKEIIVEGLCINFGYPPELHTATFNEPPSQTKKNNQDFDEKVNERAM